ncbi:MAG: RIP metalloprotease RseP [Candidatus Omnitrophica bacterium]|nr:RIP metalloprotease RseP [Candidatus Omnitrophota bacterium]
MLTILPAIIVLGVLIIVHEFGHFIACRLTRVKVDKFSIGFGPEILHWQGKETRYSLSLFPLGGFVKPAGESIEEVDESGPKPGDYLAAPLKSRMLIVSAGVVMNYFLALVIFIVLFMTGIPVIGTKIGGFVDGYPAAASGLQAGDEVLQVNGTEVYSWDGLTEAFQNPAFEDLELVVQRGRETLSLTLAPKVEDVPDMFGEVHQLRRVGITPTMEPAGYERFGFFESVRLAWEKEVFLTVMTYKGIIYLIMGKLSMKAVGGPLKIMKYSKDAAEEGVSSLLYLIGLLSISLAVINFFPIPALDGGHLVFLLIEGIRRKPVSLHFQERAAQVGFFLLISLLVFITYHDVLDFQLVDRIRQMLGR